MRHWRLNAGDWGRSMTRGEALLGHGVVDADSSDVEARRSLASLGAADTV
jgi:hypothetical protein